MTTKNNKKSKKSQNKIITVVKVGVVLVTVSVLLIGIVVTTRQYLAYKSLDKKVGEVAKLLEQSGIENIAKKDECDYENKLGPISCNISLSVSYDKLATEEVDKKFKNFINTVDSQKIILLNSTLSDNPGLKDKKPYSSTDINGNSPCISIVNTLSINSDNPDTVTLDFSCGYDAWWKQIL